MNVFTGQNCRAQYFVVVIFLKKWSGSKNENDYTIKCKIVENNETIFEVRTVAGSRDRAKRIVDNWNSNASKIYPRILDILLENKND